MIQAKNTVTEGGNITIPNTLPRFCSRPLMRDGKTRKPPNGVPIVMICVTRGFIRFRVVLLLSTVIELTLESIKFRAYNVSAVMTSCGLLKPTFSYFVITVIPFHYTFPKYFIFGTQYHQLISCNRQHFHFNSCLL